MTLPNHEYIEVKFCGDVRLSSSLVLLDVLYIPEFKFNLLSVSSFIANTLVVISFYHDSFLIQELKTRKMIGKGKLIEGLYVLDTLPPVSELSVNQVCSHTWHARLGHPSGKILQLLKTKLHLDVLVSHKDTPCSTCPLEKQKRLSFPSAHYIFAMAFDLIHCDVWGLSCIYFE